MKNEAKKQRKKPFQFHWPDVELEKGFMALIELYDPDLSVAQAVVKLIRHAVREGHIPGYIRKEHNKMIILNKDAEEIIMPPTKKA